MLILNIVLMGLGGAFQEPEPARSIRYREVLHRETFQGRNLPCKYIAWVAPGDDVRGLLLGPGTNLAPCLEMGSQGCVPALIEVCKFQDSDLVGHEISERGSAEDLLEFVLPIRNACSLWVAFQIQGRERQIAAQAMGDNDELRIVG